MRSKVMLTRISAILFLGGLVAFLIGLTMHPRFANAGGNCSSLLEGLLFDCALRDGGNFSLGFESTNTSALLAVRSFGLNAALSLDAEIITDCLCVLNVLICPDVDTQAALLGRVRNLGNTTSIVNGRAIVPGQGIEDFSCQRLETP
jgi:hypothetical protein